MSQPSRTAQLRLVAQIVEIVRMAPRKRQTMLFSATFGEGEWEWRGLNMSTGDHCMTPPQHIGSFMAVSALALACLQTP